MAPTHYCDRSQIIPGFCKLLQEIHTQIFSEVAKPLNQFLQNLEETPSQKKKFRVYWGPEQQEAFETWQKLGTESPILAYADFKAAFVLHTDASGDGLGVVLYQVKDGQKRVIAYASRSLSKSERNYPVHKLEFLALKSAITDKFHEYLYGSEFQVFTDNNPLTLCVDNWHARCYWP